MELKRLAGGDGGDEVSQRVVLAWVALDVEPGERLRRSAEVLDTNVFRVRVATKLDDPGLMSSR